jgi:hypothetical protein
MSNFTSTYERMLASNLREYEPNIRQTVGRLFARWHEALQAGDEPEIPVIGGTLPPTEYRTPEYFDELQAKAVRALCARKRHEFEAGAWAQPLPISEADCIARYQVEQRGRQYLVGQYGLLLRQYAWHCERAPLFEVFIADSLRPPGFWESPSSKRKRGRPRF